MLNPLPQEIGVQIQWKESPIFGKHFSLKQPELWFLVPTTEALIRYYEQKEQSLLPPHWKRICEDLRVKEKTLRRHILLTILQDFEKLEKSFLGEKLESLIPSSIRVNLSWDPQESVENGEYSIKTPRCESQDDLIVCSILLTICTEIFADPAWQPDDFYRNWIYSLFSEIGLSRHSLNREYGQLKKDLPGNIRSFNKAHFHLPPRKKVNRPRRRRSSEDRHGKQRISRAGVGLEVRRMYEYEEQYVIESEHPFRARKILFSHYTPWNQEETTLVEITTIDKNQHYNRMVKQWEKRLAGN